MYSAMSVLAFLLVRSGFRCTQTQTPGVSFRNGRLYSFYFIWEGGEGRGLTPRRFVLSLSVSVTRGYGYRDASCHAFPSKSNQIPSLPRDKDTTPPIHWKQHLEAAIWGGEGFTTLNWTSTSTSCGLFAPGLTDPPVLQPLIP